jgi:signal transduction histidine kinase
MTDWQRRCETLEAEVRELAAAMAHDLRAPLRAVDGFSRALAGECAGRLEGDAERYLGLVRDSARQTGVLIEGLVVLARLSVTPLRRQAIDLGALARPVLADLRAAEPERTVEVRIDEALPVEGDGALLQVLLESLLSNAFKFTRTVPHAHVELGCHQEGDRRIHYVSDSGVGFDMGRAERMFEPFCRLHPTAEFPGLGLGLARARRVVRRHGGEIWASAARGAGATFSFTLASE